MIKLAIVPVPVSDQDKALYFYTALIGLKLATDVTLAPKRRWIVLTPPGGGAQVTLVNWYDSLPSGSMRGLTFESANLEEEHARMKKAGVSIEPIKRESWGWYANAWDWDGNGLVFAEWTAGRPSTL